MDKLQLTKQMLDGPKDLGGLFDLPAVRNNCIRNYELTKRDGRGEIIFEREKLLFLKTVQENPKLVQCSRISVYSSVVELLASGLSLNEGMAYIIPYKGAASFMIGYKGRIEQMKANPDVIHIGQPQVVRKDDKFEYELGQDPKINYHRPGSSSGELQHVYMIIEYKHGKIPYVMTRDEVLKIRDGYSTGYKFSAASSPWTTDEAEMWKKTLIRRVYKTFPKTERMKNLDSKLEKRPEPEEVTQDIDYNVVDEETGEVLTPEVEVVEQVEEKTAEQEPQADTGMF